MDTQKLRLDFSSYQIEFFGNKIITGGSNWDRAKTVYSDAITRNAKGIVKFDTKLFEFPHEVYSLLKIDKDNVFVGLSRGKRCMNLLSLEDGSTRTFDGGNGIINAAWDQTRREILVGRRDGKIAVLDDNLKILKTLRLSGANTKIWSVCWDKSSIYAGDYNGIFYIIKRPALKIVYKLNVAKMPTTAKIKNKIKEGFAPNIFGIDQDEDFVFIGTRWGQLIIVNKHVPNAKMIMQLHGDVSFLKSYRSYLFIGTRGGALLRLDKATYKIKNIFRIMPRTQQENSIWDIAVHANKVYAVYSDGFISVSTGVLR